jgi:hypothetical protein
MPTLAAKADRESNDTGKCCQHLFPPVSPGARRSLVSLVSAGKAKGHGKASTDIILPDVGSDRNEHA